MTFRSPTSIVTDVDYEGKKETFEFDPAKITKDQIIKSIEELGYRAS